MVSIIGELRIKKPSHIFKHYSAGIHFFDEANCFRKKVAFVVLAQLLTGDRERGTRYTASQQINAFILITVKIMDIITYNVPMWFIVL